MTGETLPAREHFVVAGPVGAVDKAVKSFEASRNRIAQEQLFLTPA